jgi:hypothetical protein
MSYWSPEDLKSILKKYYGDKKKHKTFKAYGLAKYKT